jgi:hypothetical protein
MIRDKQRLVACRALHDDRAAMLMICWVKFVRINQRFRASVSIQLSFSASRVEPIRRTRFAGRKLPFGEMTMLQVAARFSSSPEMTTTPLLLLALGLASILVSMLLAMSFTYAGWLWVL